MTREEQLKMQELTAMLGRMRELCRLLEHEPPGGNFSALYRELSCLLNEAECRLRLLEQ